MSDIAFTLIEASPGQWRSADVDSGQMPVALRFHDDIAISPVGAVYDARVTSVDKALDMVFLDLGGGATGSLTFRRARTLAQGAANISDCVTEGQMLRAQVVNAPSSEDSQKAYAVTPRPRLLGRYVVVETGKPRVNVSKDISAKKTRALNEELTGLGLDVAVIVRSSASGVDIASVVTEAQHLATALAQPLKKEAGLVYAWAPYEQALLAAPYGESPVYSEGGSTLAILKRTAQKLWPDLLPRLGLWQGESKETAFEECGVEEAIEEALSERINLPSGGWITITPTPALTAVDVNMGGALKHMSASEAKLTVNMEATLALGFHMQFQDLGGLIVMDYIDMSTKGHSKELMTLIERTMRADSVPVQHTGISMFGLVEFTRKRSGLSLRDRYLSPAVSSERPSMVALSLLRRAVRMGQTAEPGSLCIAGPKAVIQQVEAFEALAEEVRETTKRSLVFKVQQNPDVYIEKGT